jgi:hypothetical protein
VISSDSAKQLKNEGKYFAEIRVYSLSTKLLHRELEVKSGWRLSRPLKPELEELMTQIEPFTYLNIVKVKI